MNDKKITNYKILAIQANEDVGDITVSGSGLRSANVMRAADFIVDPKGPTSAAIRAIAEGPTRTVPVAMDTLPNGSYKAKFVPTEIGDHRITVMAGNRSLPGCPFICKVGDPSKCVLRTQGTVYIYPFIHLSDLPL